LARIYQYFTDEETNEWESNDIVEAVATELERRGYFKSCDEHGSYNAELSHCPSTDHEHRRAGPDNSVDHL